MPCCYHRLKAIENLIGEERFWNFPASYVFREVYEEEKGSEFLTAPFLRLSGQSSASARRQMTEAEHLRHSIDVLRRSVLELAAQKGKSSWK